MDKFYDFKTIFIFLATNNIFLMFYVLYCRLKHAPNSTESRGFSQEKNCLPNAQPAQPLSLRDMLRETTSPVVGKKEIDNHLSNDNISTSQFLY